MRRSDSFWISICSGFAIIMLCASFVAANFYDDPTDNVDGNTANSSLLTGLLSKVPLIGRNKDTDLSKVNHNTTAKNDQRARLGNLKANDLSVNDSTADEEGSANSASLGNTSSSSTGVINKDTQSLENNFNTNADDLNHKKASANKSSTDRSLGKKSNSQDSLDNDRIILPVAELNEKYCERLILQNQTTSNQTTIKLWELSRGYIPDGLSLNSNTGMLCGTPSLVGVFRFSVSITDVYGDYFVANYWLTVKEEGDKEDNEETQEDELKILTTELSSATVGAFYSLGLNASGGKTPYQWIINGLPNEFVYDTRWGVFSGEPAAAGSVELRVTLLDSNKNSTSTILTLRILASPLSIVSASFGQGIVGEQYNSRLNAQGGMLPYFWQITSGTIADGLSFDPVNGVLSGVPKNAVETVLRVRVSDDNGSSDSADIPFEIKDSALAIITSQIESAIVGSNYSIQLIATGGEPPYSWGLKDGALPDGVILVGNSIVGTPTEEGEYSVEVYVADANSSQVSKWLSIVVGASELQITTLPKLSDAVVGEQYKLFLEAVGGTPPYNWAILSGELPKGLVLSSTDGTIVGTCHNVNSDGASGVLLQVMDSTGNTESMLTEISCIGNGLIPATDVVAAPSDGKVGLVWTNPVHAKWRNCVVVRSDVAYPDTASDGVIIYAGNRNNIVDNGLSNDKPYYYGVFANYEQDDGSNVFAEVLGTSFATTTPHSVTVNNGAYRPFVDSIVSFSPLNPQSCSGSLNMPNIVLGAPRGGGEFVASTDTVSLHSRVNNDQGASGVYGGSIVLQFTDNIVVNGQGADFTIFENAFHISGTDAYWVEPAVVDVSIDGKTFYRFPFDFVPHYDEQGNLNLTNPFSYARGFAGVRPVYSNGYSPNPTNPNVSGGDLFDLSSITTADLTWIRYVRITATGDGWLRDVNGDYVRHSNESPTWAASGSGNSGFDLDAVVAVHY